MFLSVLLTVFIFHVAFSEELDDEMKEKAFYDGLFSESFQNDEDPSETAEKVLDLFTEGKDAANKKSYGLAIKKFTEALELDPESFPASYMRGLSYYSIGDFANSLKDFERSTELNPKIGAAYNFMGLIHKRYGETEKAKINFGDSYKYSIEMRDKSSSLLNRGAIYYHEGNIEMAIKDYERALQMDYSNVNIYINLGAAFRGLKDYDKAIELYSQGLNISGSNATSSDLYFNRGLSHFSKKEYEKGIEDYSRSLEAIPAKKKSGHIYYNRAHCHEALFEYDKAIDDIKRSERNAVCKLYPSLCVGLKTKYYAEIKDLLENRYSETHSFSWTGKEWVVKQRLTGVEKRVRSILFAGDGAFVDVDNIDFDLFYGDSL